MTMVRFNIGQQASDCCRPDRMAVIVYDMQIGIVRQVKGSEAIIAKIGNLLEAARAAGYPVIFMRHMSMPRNLMGGFQMRQAMAWQKTDNPDAVVPWFLRGSPSFDIVPELAPRADEAVLDKITFSAFETTPLSIVLRDLGLVSFAICGIATEIGIDPTVRHGADLGFVPIVVRDACGGGHPEAAERAFESMQFMGDPIMSSTLEMIELMNR
jgi:biuret amidohydrolase